ncbi:hornerin-like [Psammomys obesus]|uniref:hornerin-like n=1 Tax=Psammomys obesus TaxID=48139 RepID=UPI002452E9AE|nr:hornerin-like [Psammomys obesus]
MPQLLQGIVSVINVFYQYATEHGECDMLSKKEMKELLQNELHQILKNPDDPDTVDIIMLSLDHDHNNKVDFIEYLLMVVKLVQACNKIIGKDYCQASGSKQKDQSHQHQEEQSENENKEQDISSSYSSSSAGENDSYSIGSRESNKYESKSASRKPRYGNQESTEEIRKSRHFKYTEEYEQGQHGPESTHSSKHKRGRCRSRKASDFQKHGSASRRSSTSSTQGSGQSSGIEKYGASSQQSSACGSGQSTNYGQQGSSGTCQYGSGSRGASGFSQHGSGQSQSSCGGQHGSFSGQSAGSSQHGSCCGQSSSYGQQESRSVQHQDSHTVGVSVDLIQISLPATVNKDLVQVSLLTMANMDVLQVITPTRANMVLVVVRVLSLNNMGLVSIPLLSLDKIVPDLVCVLVHNNMSLVHVTHLALDHVFLDMVNILVTCNLNQTGNMEICGNPHIAPQFVMKSNQKVCIEKKKLPQVVTLDNLHLHVDSIDLVLLVNYHFVMWTIDKATLTITESEKATLK